MKIFEPSKMVDGWYGYIRYDNAAGLTLASTSTFTVTDNATNQGVFRPGLPLKYRTTAGEGAFSYGIIKSYATGTITILGISLPDPLEELQVGPGEKICQVVFQVVGDLNVADDKLGVVMKTGFNWGLPEAYVVAVRSWVETAASEADLRVALGIGAAGNDLLDSPIFLNLAQATDIVDSEVNIDAANYNIAFLEKVYVNVDQIGSGDPGGDLTVELFIVLP